METTNSTAATYFNHSETISRGLAISVVVFLVISILAGAFGKARVCFLLRRRQDLRKVPHYLLANLAVTGIFAAVLSMPLIIIMTTVNYFQIRPGPLLEILCKIGFTSGFICTVLNALTLSIMAIDRQDRVLRPLCIASVFAFMLRKQSSVCVPFYPYNDLQEVGQVLLTLIAALHQFTTFAVLTIVITFLRILKVLRSSVVNPSSSAHQRQEMKLTRLTYKICGVHSSM